MVVQRVMLALAAQALQRHQTLQPLGLPLSLRRRQVQPLLAPVVLEVLFVEVPEAVRFLVRGVYQTPPQQVRPCSLPDTAVAAAVGPLTETPVVLAIPVVLVVQVPQARLALLVQEEILVEQEVRELLELQGTPELLGRPGLALLRAPLGIPAARAPREMPDRRGRRGRRQRCFP